MSVKNFFFFNLKKTKFLVENGSIVYISQLDTEDDFWDVIRTLENVILSCNDLFISTPPLSLNNQSKYPRNSPLILEFYRFR
jgi:hypothetical protein